MATILFIFFLIGMFHFIYEAILAPSFRLSNRYKLFKLRDDLRELSINEEITKEMYHGTEELINKSIARMNAFDIKHMYYSRKRYVNDNDFKLKVDKQSALFINCDNEKVKQINKELINLNTNSFLINSFGWVYIAIIGVFLYWIYSKLNKSIISLKDKIKSIVVISNYIPNKEFDDYHVFG